MKNERKRKKRQMKRMDMKSSKCREYRMENVLRVLNKYYLILFFVYFPIVRRNFQENQTKTYPHTVRIAFFRLNVGFHNAVFGHFSTEKKR